MNQHSRNADESDTESSLPYSITYWDSDADSLSESIGSVETVSSKPTLVVKPQTLVWRPKKDSNSGPQFLQFSREMRDVSVEAAWGLFRNFRIAAAGIVLSPIASFEWVEGVAGTPGSCFRMTYTPQRTRAAGRAGKEDYSMSKIEVLDDDSRMSAVRCLSGKHMKQFKLLITFMKVVPHEVLGDSSCVVMYRLEYKPRKPGLAVPEEMILSYKTIVDLLRDRHCSLDRVQRPLVSHDMQLANMKKRLGTRARLSRICANEQKPEIRIRSQVRRKSRVQLLENDEEAVDRDGRDGRKRKERPRRNSRARF